MSSKIIAVDFDGTLCENAWPEIGAPRQAVIDYVLEQQMYGAKLILWTNRSGEYLHDALVWCNDRGIRFDAVNENVPEMVEYFHNDCRKVFANEYIDDRAIPMPGEPTLTISRLVQEAHQNAVNHGFWDNPPEFGTSVALIHSELSEALEEVRADRPAVYYPCNAGGVCCEDDGSAHCGSRVWNPDTPEIFCKAKSKKPEGYATELADAVIRIADLCGYMGIDLEAVIREKMAYNATRPYKHGKSF